jgi:hypothetical protein
VYITPADIAASQAEGRRHRLDCLAVLLELRRPTVAASHASAAHLWGFLVRRQRLTTVRLTDPTLSRKGRGYVVTQAPLRPADVVRNGPLRWTSAARTLLDCAREWDVDDAVVALDAALRSGATTSAELRGATEALRGWPRVRRAVRAVDLADGRAESPLETRGRLRLVGAGFTPTELQVEIRSSSRLIGVVDAWFDEAAVAVEFDGQVKYRDPWRNRSPEQVLWDEKRREDELRALDVRVVRIVDRDVDDEWARKEAHLRRLLAVPGPADRRFTATARPLGRQRAG